jgi:Tfp pilus assembly protein PilN
MTTEARRTRRTQTGRWPRPLDGALTVVAFTESGRMHRARVSRRLLLAVGILALVLLVGSTASVLRLFREQVDLARMTYLEQENKSLTSLLEGQAEQLSRLKLEVARLKEFEQNLRVVSGMDAQPDPAAGTGPPSTEPVEKKGFPRKR